MISPILCPGIQVEIHENERAWIGGGFSKKGLLPNDCGRFSTIDGSLSWKTKEEAADCLLEKGWTYIDEEFTPALMVPNEFFASEGNGKEKEKGWKYARDFSTGAIQNAKNKRSIALHWVRFRRLVRKKIFDPEQWLPIEVYSKCSHGDSEVKADLSTKILEVLAFVSMVQSSHLTYTATLPLKAKVIEVIDIGNEATRIYEEDAYANISILHKKLEAFANTESHALSNVFSKISNVNFKLRHNKSLTPGFEEHCAAVSSRISPQNERDAIASLILRDLDPKFLLHCDKENCGATCVFAPELCTNDGCDVLISIKHMPAHDSTCPFKVIHCPRECGNMFPRKELEIHKTKSCPIREVPCSFAKVGCPAVVLAQDLEAHISESTNSHLLIAMNRMMEHQSVIKVMHNKVRNLEAENAHLKRLFDTYKVEVAKEVSSVSSQVVVVKKKVNGLETTSRNEFKRIRDKEKLPTK